MDSKPCARCGVQPRKSYSTLCKFCLSDKRRRLRAKLPPVPKDPDVTPGVTKRCLGCTRVKPLLDFNVRTNRRGGRMPRCIECTKAEAKRYYYENQDRLLAARLREINETEKHCKSCNTTKPRAEFAARRNVKDGMAAWCKACQLAYGKGYSYAAKKLGMTQAQYHRLCDRHTNCEVCGESFQNTLRCIDHDHATQQYRGMLCMRCNLALGQARDDPLILRDLARYIERKARELQGDQQLSTSP